SELHERLSSPFYAFSFVLIVLALMGQAQTTRQNRVKSVVGAFAAALICRIIGIITNNAVVVRPGISALLYVVPLAAALLAGLATRRHLYPRPPSPLERALERLNEGAWRWLAAIGARLSPGRAAQRARG